MAAPELPPLIGGARVEVCILGAGLPGLLAGYLLAREGRSVMVVEEGPAAGGAAAAAVQLANMIEPPYAPLEREHGMMAARLAAQSFRGAVETLEAIVRRERIACDFERLDGYCFGGDDPWTVARREFEAAYRAGRKDAELLDAAPVPGSVPEPCVRFHGQVQLHPQRFVDGLARAIAHAGGRLYFGVAVKALEPGRPATVVTSHGHRIAADAIVMAGRRGLAREGRTRGLALRMPRAALGRAIYWEASHPHFCARLRTTGAGGSEHLLVVGDMGYPALESWARARFPMCGDVMMRVEGDPPGACDLFACVSQEGEGSEGVYVSTAGWGSPMTRATVAAITVKDFLQASCLERDFAYGRM